MDESLINHLFLPQFLPSSAAADFLIAHNHQNEYVILEAIKEYFYSIISNNVLVELPVLKLLMTCVEHWSYLQNIQNSSISNIRNILISIQPGNYFAFYFHAQNAAILIEIDKNDANQALLSSWQVLLSNEEITSSIMPYLSCFPTTTYRLSNRSYLHSKVHCELLVDFIHNTIEYRKSHNYSNEANEIREIPESHYVHQWWIEHFEGINIETKTSSTINFKKKHRDQIRWNNALLPFRRSGLWAVVKVVFQSILTRQLGSVGTIVYKLLITDFLSYIICRKHSKMNTDLIVHCIRKVIRRLDKIEKLLVSSSSYAMNRWVIDTREKIIMKIQQILPKNDWQESIKINHNENLCTLSTNTIFNDPKIYQHFCIRLIDYLNTNKFNNETSRFVLETSSYDFFCNVAQQDYIPSYSMLKNQMNFTIGMALTYIELWVELNLQEWINQPLEIIDGMHRFELLLHLFEEYQKEALHYCCSVKDTTDPISYSRFILTSLTIIRCMHKKLCNDKRFERLKLHSLRIPNILDLFEFLILPNCIDMIRAYSLYGYFAEFRNKLYPDLLQDVTSPNAFGVYFASLSETMISDIQRIRHQAEIDKQAKIKEVNNAKINYSQLMNIVNKSQCVSSKAHGKKNCQRCKTLSKANKINVKIYECPLPQETEHALAVMFELQMPIEIRCYRDIIWQFINRPESQPKCTMHEWLNNLPHDTKLKPFYKGPVNPRVKLVSTTKSISKTHYSTPPSIESTPAMDFLFENSLKVTISPTKTIKLIDERRFLTHVLDHPDFKPLQYTLESTQFRQNDVIAQSPSLSLRLKRSQLIEFGSFRSGHRLQWWNLLMALEMDSLALAEESIAILIIQSILQYGPLEGDCRRLTKHWCPESHDRLLDDNFVDEITLRLERHLNECEANWQNDLVLLVITMITMRILTVCNSTRKEKLIDFSRRCRQIGENWLDLISKNIGTLSVSTFTEVEKLRLKLVNIGVTCVLTFATDQNNMNTLLSSNKDVVFLLKAISTIHDNAILNKNRLNMSNFMRNMQRFSERILVMLQPTIAAYLAKTSYQSLNEFSASYWTIIKRKGSMNGQWKKRINNSYDGWYDCKYESRIISINFLHGAFLIDGMTIGFLPETIIQNELFVRVFHRHVFEVQASDSPGIYITKHSYHDNGRVQYEFQFNEKTNCLIVRERYVGTNNVLQLIPNSIFETELPHIFVSNYSHWWNEESQTIDFRPIHFTSKDFLTNRPYVLSLKTGNLTTTEMNSRKILINSSSVVFENLFNQYFVRLDYKPFVYMMQESTSKKEVFIHIHLSRLGIAFQYISETNKIVSREYSDMCIDENQRLETLTGLTSGLLLSPLLVHTHSMKPFPYRKLIIPFGQVATFESPSHQHQIVNINRSLSIPFTHQYFVFIVNDRLNILQPIDSPAGWLYLALLHAMTSHPLQDKFTGLTGMERAFQLLNSAGSCSDQPYDSICLNILEQIALISPKVNYYPNHLRCMIQIDWNSYCLPHSMQHFGYYLIAKWLIRQSQQFNFMYTSSNNTDIPAIFIDNTSTEVLLEKLYWDYRDSYNPIARLPNEMEKNIWDKSNVKPCVPTTKYYSQIPERSNILPTGDLYKKGSINLIDCSRLQWLPLSQWLNPENQLANIWIGLLQCIYSIRTYTPANATDKIEQLMILINFLHHVSKACGINSIYFRMLRTALTNADIFKDQIDFPPFGQYVSIQHISVVPQSISVLGRYEAKRKSLILAEIEDSWQKKRVFVDPNQLIIDSAEIDQINQLLLVWYRNKILRTFLETVQNSILLYPLERVGTIIQYYPQQFAVELISDHHQIQMSSQSVIINEKLLQAAIKRFHHSFSGHFNISPTCPQATTSPPTLFPHEIFSVTNDQHNHLEKIDNYFKTQLQDSWQHFLEEKQIQNVNPTIEEIARCLGCLQEESASFFQALIISIRCSNKLLLDVGLLPRISPAVLIPVLEKKTAKLTLSVSQLTLLGAILVCWTLEQQLERTLHYMINEKHDEFVKEMLNIPHSNWTPSHYVSWLILELEMNITIREVQVNVALHMMNGDMITPRTTMRNIVMQLNMGEGKTSIILPMLAVHLSSSNSQLIRIQVLKSLFPTNYQSLQYKLGGLMNRRIFPFLCRRDMNFNDKEIHQIFDRFQRAMFHGDVVLTSPEDILSFELLTIEKCRRCEFNVANLMLRVQRWLKMYARDILDESDEILHVKYQLIYAIGVQKQVDGGNERWETIQMVLDLIKTRAEYISIFFHNNVHYKPARSKSGFPEFRVQSRDAFTFMCKLIVMDWLCQKSYRSDDEKVILSFILNREESTEILKNRFSTYDVQLFLIFRGLLSFEVLFTALKKRYRVNYGIQSSPSFDRLMAVPFRAKDVAADRTEFGHPDIAIILTCLSYYYSGLNESQMGQCFNRLNVKEPDPACVYEQWIAAEQENKVIQTIKQWKNVNFKDYEQRTRILFPMLQYNTLIINYFLNHFVFPKEAKQFPHKLVSSAWDLSSSLRFQPITGFSGTNDTQLLLPVHMFQHDLPELKKTDAIVLNNLLHEENENYQNLPTNISSDIILEHIINYKTNINVILDVGALFIDGTNRDIAMKWLNRSDTTRIDYAVYFHSDSIVVCDRQYHQYRFDTSPASERLDRCVFYLDEVHTRGTDFKFPNGFQAVVTLGNGLTKDRFVQACMRMRKLGKTHSLSFWSSNEVHQQILTLKQTCVHTDPIIDRNISNIKIIDILRWVYENTKQSTWDGLHHWATQSLSYRRKLNAYATIHLENDGEQITDEAIVILANECIESEVTDLQHMYGTSKQFETIDEIYSKRYLPYSNNLLAEVIHVTVLKRLREYSGTKVRLTQILDDQQQRELESEVEEERQLSHPQPVKPWVPLLCKEIKKLCDTDEKIINLASFSNAFYPLPDAFMRTAFAQHCQPQSWRSNFWISSEFQHVVEGKSVALDAFMRPPRWILVYRNEHVIFISPLEANYLMYYLKSNKSSITTLRLLLPRIKRDQSIFVNSPMLTIPSLIRPSDEISPYFISNKWLAELFVFNGTIYFENSDQQTAYCRYLGVYPQPRTPAEQEAFENGWISVDGFISESSNERKLSIAKGNFRSNPLPFIRNLIENRNDFVVPILSHVGSIIFNARKLL